MDKLEEAEILQKYKLSKEEHELYYEIIKRTYTAGKIPERNPIAIIIGGQTGAGKSSIIGYSTKMFKDNNVIVINSDEIKPFHPKSEEIARLYPKMYTKITDQESNTWTSRLFEELRREGYNIIFEGTMKNNRIADESINELKKIGYTVIVRGLAVCDLESRMSILERYEWEVATKGWGRLVVPEHHDQTYRNMPETIQYIQENDKYDILEIYARGEIPSEPVLLYSKHNSKEREKTEKAIKGRDCVSKNSRSYGYLNAKDAILRSRDEEYETVIPTAKERLRSIMDSMNRRNAKDIEKEMVMDVFNVIEKIHKEKPEVVNKIKLAYKKLKKITAENREEKRERSIGG